MKKRSIQEELDNIIMPVLMVLAVFVFVGVAFDCYYDLNDDMVIKDILAGSYTGQPSGYTNQMLYPLGLLLSGLYKVFGNAPVFGLFLSGCFGVCFSIIGYRSLAFFTDRKIKAAAILLEGMLILAMYLWELTYLQYSVISGLLAATACFWFYTIPRGIEIKEFWKQSLPALVLVWVAFLVRSEMLLLMCPFLAVVGILHWGENVMLQVKEYQGPGKAVLWEQIFKKKNLFCYVGLVMIMVLGLVLCYVGDFLAYRTSEWQKFQHFFDARTQVYDYTWYPDYEKQQEFYENIGISKEQYQLINTYNFGLDETIDANTLKKVASYGEKQSLLGPVTVRIKNLVWELVHNIYSANHGPYNYFVLAGYLMVLGLAILQKDRSYLWKLLVLMGMRTVSWGYLIWSARVVDRIAHPLYLAEFFILMAMLISELYDRPLWNVEKYYRQAVAAVLVVIVLFALPMGYGRVKADQIRREQILVNQKLLDDYCKKNSGNYYYLDVYSTVDFTEKIYHDVDNSRKNYDLLGGWICHSPLQKEVRGEFVSQNEEESPENSIEKALLMENFYFVAESIADTEFLTEYYKFRETDITLELVDTVGKGDNPFLVYKLEAAQK